MSVRNNGHSINNCLILTFIGLQIACSLQSTCGQNSENSTRKRRVKPNPISAKAGTAIHWTANWQDAVAKSNQTKKPIFWYVPTLPNTFMDRKTEIDRYLMAGPFSWPPTIELINKNYVPVKLVPTSEQQKQFDLVAYKFVEPGFLIVQNDRTIGKIDQITTFHPEWWQAVLGHFGAESAKTDHLVNELIQRFNRSESFEQDAELSAKVSPYQLLFLGMDRFRNGDHANADAAWQSLVDQFPQQPLAWKAAAEIQRIGPFSRGFEIYTNLPKKNRLAGIHSRGTRSVAGVYKRQELWHRGTQFLLSMQNQSGGFLDSDYDFGGTDSLPNVHVAVTSLAAMALIESVPRSAPSDRPKILNALDKCCQFVTNEKNINRMDRDEILWADAYRLRFLCRYQNLVDKPLDEAIQHATTALEGLQSKRGGWYHEYENAFVTATALCALADALKSRATLDLNKVNQGVAALQSERNVNGTFPYSSRRRRAQVNLERLVPGSAGRMPICELALHLWDVSDQSRLESAIETSFAHHDKLAVALKYDNHTSTHAYGGFFFWYDMRSRTEAILALDNHAMRKKYLERQLALVMALPEIDGCFVDSHELGRCYGTAMALLCLAGIESELTQ